MPRGWRPAGYQRASEGRSQLRGRLDGLDGRRLPQKVVATSARVRLKCFAEAEACCSSGRCPYFARWTSTATFITPTASSSFATTFERIMTLPTGEQTPLPNAALQGSKYDADDHPSYL